MHVKMKTIDPRISKVDSRNADIMVNPHVSVDCVVFGFDENKLKVLLIEQDQLSTHQHEKRLALPGNLVYEQESLDKAAERVLLELTNLTGVYLRQFHAFGNPERVRKEADKLWLQKYRSDPNARVITIAYYSLVRMELYIPKAGSFAASSYWVDINDVPDLAFDHNEILDKALNALQEDLGQHKIGIDLLPKKFTLGQLQRLYEVILDKELDKRNFRKTIKRLPNIKPLNEKQIGVSHKPAQLFRFVGSRRKQQNIADFDL